MSAPSQDSSRQLNCLIEGESIVFSLTVDRDCLVSDFREMIHVKRALDSIKDLHTLELWKVDVVLRRGEEDSLRHLKLEDVRKDAEKLSSWLTVNDYWADQPLRNYLSVLIRLPSTYVLGKRIRSGEDYWREGWEQTGDDNRWKLFGDYWRKQNARDRSSITLVYEERGEGDPTYRLSLSPETDHVIVVRDCYKALYDSVQTNRGGLYNGLILTGQPGTGKTMWLAYALVRLLTENETVLYHSSGGTYLFFEDSVYSRIRKEGTELPQTERQIFCLIDPDTAQGEKELHFITNSNMGFPVVASSPNPSRYKNLKKRKGIHREFMPLWARDELKNGLKMQKRYNYFQKVVEMVLASLSDGPTTSVTKAQHDQIVSALEMIRDNRDDLKYNPSLDEVLDRILDNAIEAFGSAARDVYMAIFTPEAAEEDINDAMSNMDYNALDEAVRRLNNVEGGDNSHRLFSMEVTDPTRRSFKVRFKSRYIRTKVLNHLEFLKNHDIAATIRKLKQLSDSSSYAGTVYESHATRVLATGVAPSSGLVSMQTETDKISFSIPRDTTVSPSPFSRPRKRSYACSSNLPGELDFGDAEGESLADYIWIPMAQNNPLFDAFVIEFKFDDSHQKIDAAVWVLQVTLSRVHRGSSKGYEMIDVIRKKTKRAMLAMARAYKIRKPGNVTVKYVLVSPEGGRWKLPEKDWETCEGDVFYQRVEDVHDQHVETSAGDNSNSGL